MTIPRILLCLLLAMCVTVGAALFTPEPPGGHGVPHDEFSDMLRGSPAPPSERITFLGWTFGVLQIVLFVTCMTLGIRRRRIAGSETASRRLLILLSVVGSGLYVGVWTQIVRADHAATTSGNVAFLGPFPTATSWMLFGLWLAPLVFVAAYVIGFSRWIMPEESLSRFEALLAERHGQATAPSPKESPPLPVGTAATGDDMPG